MLFILLKLVQLKMTLELQEDINIFSSLQTLCSSGTTADLYLQLTETELHRQAGIWLQSHISSILHGSANLWRKDELRLGTCRDIWMTGVLKCRCLAMDIYTTLQLGIERE
jgi:hypothetical protein